jgi:HNH endonuclease
LSSQAKKKSSGIKRTKIPLEVRIAVLTEAGYRCGNPTCPNILALDLHHMAQVSEGGGNVLENLLALCLNCHGLYHRGTIAKASIYAWKSVLVSLTRAFDVVAIDQLKFLSKPEVDELRVTGDGVLGFTRLIGAGLATFELTAQNGPLFNYSVTLTPTGKQLFSAWVSGNRTAVELALGAGLSETDGSTSEPQPKKGK